MVLQDELRTKNRLIAVGGGVHDGPAADNHGFLSEVAARGHPAGVTHRLGKPRLAAQLIEGFPKRNVAGVQRNAAGGECRAVAPELQVNACFPGELCQGVGDGTITKNQVDPRRVQQAVSFQALADFRGQGQRHGVALPDLVTEAPMQRGQRCAPPAPPGHDWQPDARQNAGCPAA